VRESLFAIPELKASKHQLAIEHIQSLKLPSTERLLYKLTNSQQKRSAPQEQFTVSIGALIPRLHALKRPTNHNQTIQRRHYWQARAPNSEHKVQRAQLRSWRLPSCRGESTEFHLKQHKYLRHMREEWQRKMRECLTMRKSLELPCRDLREDWVNGRVIPIYEGWKLSSRNWNYRSTFGVRKQRVTGLGKGKEYLILGRVMEHLYFIIRG